MTIPSYSSCLSAMGISSTRCPDALSQLQPQVLLDNLPGITARARHHRVCGVRRDAHLVEPFNRCAIIGELRDGAVRSQLARDLARHINRAVAQIRPLTR